MKKMGQILNKTICKHNDKSTFPTTFIINNEQVADKQEIAEGFNKFFFSEISFKTGQSVPAPHTIITFQNQLHIVCILRPISENTV